MENSNQPQNSAPIREQVGFPANAPKPKKSINPIFIIIPVFLLILGGLAYFVFKGSSTQETTPSPTPQSQELSSVVTPSPSPSATPKTVADKGALSVRILNGTGVAGEAGYLQGILKALGYTKIETANADTTDATSATIVYQKTVAQSLIDELLTRLKSEYKSVDSRVASVKGSFDIEITTGPRKGAATATPTTSSPTPTASSTPIPSQ